VNFGWIRKVFLAVVLALTLGVPFYSAPVLRAQTSGESSTPEAQSPQKDKQEADETEQYRKSPAVIAIGRHLGLNPDQSATAFELFNFIVLAGSLAWLAAKVLPKAIRGRNAAIRKHITDAEVATKEARARLSSVEQRLSKLDDEIAAMRTHAEQDAAREEQRFRAAVEEEKRKILAAAEQEISAATVHAQQQLKQQAAELAIEQAARKLVVSAETDRLLVQGFAQRLTGEKKGQN
jgi:F-type H+-transporting ATPase subunit b